MKIDVTQDMIDRGRPGDCYDCPVALAISAACPGAEFVRVQYAVSEWEMPGRKRVKMSHPLKLAEYIRDFDDGKPVQPQTFDLPVAP